MINERGNVRVILSAASRGRFFRKSPPAISDRDAKSKNPSFFPAGTLTLLWVPHAPSLRVGFLRFPRDPVSRGVSLTIMALAAEHSPGRGGTNPAQGGSPRGMGHIGKDSSPVGATQRMASLTLLLK